MAWAHLVAASWLCAPSSTSGELTLEVVTDPGTLDLDLLTQAIRARTPWVAVQVPQPSGTVAPPVEGATDARARNPAPDDEPRLRLRVALNAPQTDVLAELVDGGGEALWRETFDRNLGTETIATAVALSLEGALSVIRAYRFRVGDLAERRVPPSAMSSSRTMPPPPDPSPRFGLGVGVGMQVFPSLGAAAPSWHVQGRYLATSRLSLVVDGHLAGPISVEVGGSRPLPYLELWELSASAGSGYAIPVYADRLQVGVDASAEALLSLPRVVNEAPRWVTRLGLASRLHLSWSFSRTWQLVASGRVSWMPGYPSYQIDTVSRDRGPIALNFGAAIVTLW